MLNSLNFYQEELRKLGIKSLNLFGSVVRDQATPQGDVDVLVELDESANFLDFGQDLGGDDG